jgi:hypothetical protein
MSNVLPVIEMPAKEPEPEPVKPEVGTAKENVLPETGDGNMDILDQLQEKKVEFEDNIITVDEREIPSEDEVFTERPAPKMKPIVVEEEALEQQSTEFEPARKGKRKYVRKAPMSEKQKEHLARIRQIAIEKRKAEKERKIKEKEEAVIEKAEKKILEKKKKEEEKEYSEQKKQQELINNPPQQKVVQQNGFTKEDLDNAVLSAITQYDTLRKQQKKEKKVQEAKQREEDKMRATLQRAIQPQQRQVDPWRSLFS